jgi:hypothetical protein
MILGPALDPAPDRDLPSDIAFRDWLRSLDPLTLGQRERFAILTNSDVYIKRYTRANHRKVKHESDH